MEKVWEELKKIEAQAEQIRGEAQDKSKQIADIAKQEAEGFLADSKSYAQEDAQQLLTNVDSDANRKREEELKSNAQITEKLTARAQERMDQATDAIVNAVLGEKDVDADHKVR
jgi:vacuolar-type H+-ATPase subunit H